MHVNVRAARAARLAGSGRGRKAMTMALRWMLTLFMVGSGSLHFIVPDIFIGMIPDALPAPRRSSTSPACSRSSEVSA